MKIVYIFLLILLISIKLNCDEPADLNVSLADLNSAKKEIRAIFEFKTKEELKDLSSNKNITIRLHAMWELAKADKIKTAEFIKLIDLQYNIATPSWWQNLLLNITIHESQHHSFSGVDSSKLTENSILIFEDYKVVAKPRSSGFPYKLSVKLKDVELWSTQIWSANRGILTGGTGVHQIELFIKEDNLFVFGAEGHGAYLEVFNLKTGLPNTRFSTCFWFQFSESWGKKK